MGSSWGLLSPEGVPRCLKALGPLPGSGSQSFPGQFTFYKPQEKRTHGLRSAGILVYCLYKGCLEALTKENAEGGGQRRGESENEKGVREGS